MTTILVTGFEPFPSAPFNPTAWLIGQLRDEGWEPKGARLRLEVLPTVYDVWARRLGPLVEEVKPDAVVQFGLSAKARGFTLERTAINTQHTDKPDSEGAFAATPWIEPMAEGTRSSGLNLNAIATALEEAGLAWDFSDHAGLYICNLVFFRTRIALPHTPTGFVHVPYTLPLQEAALAAGAPTPEGMAMSEADMLRAAKIVLESVAAGLATV